MRKALLLSILILFSGPAHAQGKPMQLELAEPRVDITTGFNGARVVLFGTTAEDNPQLAVTLKGPKQTIVMRQKKRTLGAWMNRDSMEFRIVPTYYDYALSISEDAFAQSVLEQGEIGVDRLGFYAEDEAAPDMIANFRDALIRERQEKGFYPVAAGEILFLNPRFFKVSFDLPPGVPTGNYTIEAMAISDAQITARETRTLQVGQVGFNARVYLFADEHSFLYGVFAVLMALAAGWGAFTFLRRD